MMKNEGKRTKRIVELEEEREDSLNAIVTLTRTLKAKQTRLMKERDKLMEPARLTNLKVTWEQDGEEKVIGPLAEADPTKFLMAVDSIPRSVRAQMDAGKLQRLETIRGELNQIPRTFKVKKAELETKIYRCDERLAALK
jgi:hypothetical protein